MKNAKLIIFTILLFPLASTGNSDYTKAVEKISEALYKDSYLNKEMDYLAKDLKRSYPKYLVRPLEILLPTLNALREGRLELRYLHEF